MKKALIFALHLNGRVAERLGRALQKLVQRFESVHDLSKKDAPETAASFLFWRIIFMIQPTFAEV